MKFFDWERARFPLSSMGIGGRDEPAPTPSSRRVDAPDRLEAPCPRPYMGATQRQAALARQPRHYCFVTAPSRDVCVLVSYSHESRSHRINVESLADALHENGFSIFLDLWETPPPPRWPPLLEKWFGRADAVVCVCTPTYRDRCDGVIPAGDGRGATYEGELIRNETFDLKRPSDRFHVVSMKDTELAIPWVLGGKGTHYYRWPEDHEQLARTLATPTNRRTLVDCSKLAFGGNIDALEAWARHHVPVGKGTMLDFEIRGRRVIDDVLRIDDPRDLKDTLVSLAALLSGDEWARVDNIAHALQLGRLPRPIRPSSTLAGSDITHERTEFPQPLAPPAGPPSNARSALPPTRHRLMQRPRAGAATIGAARGGVELMLVPGGPFLMGSTSDDASANSREKPQHEVWLDDFYLARTPVTNSQYAEYLAATNAPEPEYWHDHDFNDPDQPVVGVSWQEAQEYCRWAGLSLPTEAQWEYACRAGTSTQFWSGDTEEDLTRVGWYAGNSGRRLHRVGEKEPNGFGLHDIHGNIWEWCEDGWTDDYEGARRRRGDGLRILPERILPEGHDQERSRRGGSFRYAAHYARSRSRHHSPPERRSVNLGFRPALKMGEREP
jgi:formylglycine-generating enzyme required for sulfatase activity